MMMKRRLAAFGAAVVAGIVALILTEPASAASRPDAWVTTKVKLSLLTNEGLSGLEVNVDTVDGLVTLHGSVATDAEKTRAAQVAKGVEGVRDVRNLLQVVPSAKKEHSEANDEQLQEHVAAALKADPALRDSSIDVQSVHEGVVLLAGKAETLSDTYRAVDTAAGVAGVRRVESEIHSPDGITDEEIWRDGAYDAAAYDQSSARDLWITTATKMRLFANDQTPASDINVDTENRTVTLFGMVPSAAAKQAAETEAKKVGGVQKVVNDLQIVAEAKQDRVTETDDAVTKAVEARLGEHELGGSDIDVAVSNGVARLTGTVESRRDQLTALTVARTTDGVKKVIDDLRLEAPAVSAR